MSRNRDSFNDINITPLTDIFLVLLIIMMVIAPMLDQQGLNLTVPDNVEESQVKSDTKIMTVSVTEDDKYIIDDSEITVDNLEAIIKEKVPANPDGMMIVAAPDSSHGAVVRLMDIARNSGVKSISMDEG